MEEIAYLGDGVYLSFDGYQYWLAANHHENKVIALEQDVLLQLNAEVAKHRARLAETSAERNDG